MGIDIRSLREDELEQYLLALSGPFSFDPPPDPEKRREWIERASRSFEPARARCAFDGDRMVGTLGTFTLDMTVPGGRVSCAGTTQVSVQPTHRRQGVLRRMIQAHLAEALERGDPIAALWASDSAIYGRFGYGMASTEVHLELSTSHLTRHRLAPAATPVRMIGREEAEKLLPSLYDRVVDERPGTYRRPAHWWTDRRLRDEPEQRDGATAYRFAVAEGPSGPIGYAQYRVKQGWTDHHGANQIRVTELVGLEPEAWTALWLYLLHHDLTTSLQAPHRPVDDPLFSILEAPRRAAPEITDALWVRLVDIPAALSARSYRVGAGLTMEVSDPMGLSGGRFKLEASPEGSSCRPTADEPELSLDIEDLGAAYLGRARFGALWRAGRVEGSPEAIRRADLLFGWDPPPWCPEVF